MPLRIFQLGEDFDGQFPRVNQALREPNGLLAMGGNLRPSTLLAAYKKGIFPWNGENDPLLWWSPDPRYGFIPGQLHLSRSRRRVLRQMPWIIRADSCFENVLAYCAAVPRTGQRGTWITQDMASAFSDLYRLGYGHSIEVFEGSSLIGGLYGLAIGRLFFAESMFSLQSQASTAALLALSVQLNDWQWPWIDAQMENPHLALLGGKPKARADYMTMVASETAKNGKPGTWTAAFGEREIGKWLAKAT